MNVDDDAGSARRERLSMEERLELLERDTRDLARQHTAFVNSSKSFSPEQMEQLRTVFRDELADAGLRVDEAEHQDAAREDFRFLRRLRMSWDGAVSRTGNAVLLAVIGIAATIIGLGFWAWLGSNINK
jgi:hypothetical protein